MNQQSVNVGSGSGNTIIQMVGDNNLVGLIPAYLQLTRHIKRAQKTTSQLQQLIPYNRTTTLVGRDLDLADLRRFAESPDAISVRVLTGSGGAGKTRLALDFCDELAAKGWDSGFVGEGDAGGESSELQRFAQSQNLSTWGWRKPTFIVVDYAASHVSALATWIAALARRESPDPAQPARPLRLLLLERHAQVDSGWWAGVFGSGAWAAVAKQNLLNPREPVVVAPLTSAAHRAEVMNQVLAANVPAGKFALHVDEALVDQYLSGTSWGGDPLFLMMAALYAIEAGHTEALALPRTKLAQAVAVREAARIAKLADVHQPHVPPDLAQHLAACVTLAGGMSKTAFIAFARIEKVAIGHDVGCDPATLAALLTEALPANRAGTLSPILPDLIGEAFLAHVCHDQDASAIQRWRESLGMPVLQSLMRCAQDFAVSDKDFPLPQLTAWCQTISDDASALSEFDQLIPMESVALGALNLRVAEYRVATLSAESTDDPARRADRLTDLAISQANMGEHESALTAAQEAVMLYRALAARRPEVFAPHLATALNGLANRLSALGERERALAAAQEAMTLRRALAAPRMGAFSQNLATSLNNLASFLGDLGEDEQALAAVQEAVTLFRALFAKRPDAFAPDLAMSLGNLAQCLGEVGEREQALAAVQEAVTLFRSLAAQRPDAFTANLATSLNNLANLLSFFGEREIALTAAQEAVTLRRALAAQRPNAFTSDLAMSLINLPKFLSELGENEVALTTAQEAVSLYRALAEKRPDAFAPDLASSLHNLANASCALGEREQAFRAAQEAVALYRTLAAKRPNVFAEDLARSLAMFDQLKSADPEQGATE